MGLKLGDRFEVENFPRSSADLDQGFRERLLRSPRPLGE